MMRDLVGYELPPLRVQITEHDVRRYCRAVRRVWDGKVPWLYLANCGGDQVSSPERTDRLSGRPTLFPSRGPSERVVVGGQEWRFGVRPRLGDVVTIKGSCTSMEEKQGARSGPMTISTLELTYTNDRNEQLAWQRLTRIHR
jgi:hypothetical protein